MRKKNMKIDIYKMNKKYDVIYADPPWSYKDKKSCDPAMGGITYDVMELEDIKAMGETIQKISNKDCALFLWVTMPMLQEGLDVIKAWGFDYKTCAFTWVKLNPSKKLYGPYGIDDSSCAELDGKVNSLAGCDFYSGLGHWTNGNAELCLFAKKGRPKRKNKNIKQILIAPRGRHSAKPEEARNRIDKLIEAENKLELFCRGTGGAGWDVWGNESE